MTAERREKAVAAKDRRDLEHNRQIVVEHFPRIPSVDLEMILEHGFEKGSGRVGRTSRLSGSVKAELAVNAHIRHRHTDYDENYRGIRASYGYDNSELKSRQRARVHNQVKAVADNWRPTKPPKQIPAALSNMSKAKNNEPKPSERTSTKLKPLSMNEQTLEGALNDLKLGNHAADVTARHDRKTQVRKSRLEGKMEGETRKAAKARRKAERSLLLETKGVTRAKMKAERKQIADAKREAKAETNAEGNIEARPEQGDSDEIQNFTIKDVSAFTFSLHEPQQSTIHLEENGPERPPDVSTDVASSMMQDVGPHVDAEEIASRQDSSMTPSKPPREPNYETKRNQRLLERIQTGEDFTLGNDRLWRVVKLHESRGGEVDFLGTSRAAQYRAFDNELKEARQKGLKVQGPEIKNNTSKKSEKKKDKNAGAKVSKNEKAPRMTRTQQRKERQAARNAMEAATRALDNRLAPSIVTKSLDHKLEEYFKPTTRDGFIDGNSWPTFNEVPKPNAAVHTAAPLSEKPSGSDTENWTFNTAVADGLANDMDDMDIEDGGVRLPIS